jgi:hypothetical protein
MSMQQGLGGFYSVPVLSMLAVAMMDAAARGPIKAPAWRAAALVLVVLGVHFYNGFLAFGGKSSETYTRLKPEGLQAIAASRRVPPEGILLTEVPLSGFCGNRRDLIADRYYKPDLYTYDCVFSRVSMLPRLLRGAVFEEIVSGELGIRTWDDAHVIAQRGYTTDQNEAFLRNFPFRSIWIHTTPSHGGEDCYSRRDGPVRRWEGAGSRAPINLTFGGHRQAPPGRYRAVLEYRVSRPRRIVRGSWGTFSVHRLNEPNALVEIAIPEIESDGSWTRLILPFETDRTVQAEPRVTGGDAPLILRRMWVEPDGPERVRNPARDLPT